MIRNKLSDLLGERQIKISKLSLMTGIARSTLTPIYYNNSEMIKLDTINKICKALQINVKDFFENTNFDIFFTIDEDEWTNSILNISSDHYEIVDQNLDITSLIEISEVNQKFYLEGIFKLQDESKLTDEVIYMQTDKEEGFWYEESSTLTYELVFEDENDKKTFKDYTDKLSIGMTVLLKNNMKKFIWDFLVESFKDDNSNLNDDIPKQKFKDIFEKCTILVRF